MKKNLFNIINAQIRYSKYKLYITLLIFFSVVIYSYIRAFSPVNLLSFLLFVHFVSLLILKNNKENREIIFRLLTIPSKNVAIARIIMIYLCYSSIYLLSTFINFFTINSAMEFRDSYHELFMFGGIGLLGVFLYLIFADFFTIFRSKSGYIWFNIITAVILGAWGFMTIFTILNVYNTSISSSTQIIFLLYIGSFICTIISYFTYQKRESYLGYK